MSESISNSRIQLGFVPGYAGTSLLISNDINVDPPLLRLTLPLIMFTLDDSMRNTLERQNATTDSLQTTWPGPVIMRTNADALPGLQCYTMLSQEI